MAIQVTPYNPQQTDLGSSVQRLLQMKSLMQGQQIQQQTIQAGQQENEQRAIALKDQQTVNAAIQKHQGDLGAALQELPGQIAPQTFLALQQKHLEAQKALQEKSDKDLQILKEKGDAIGGLVAQAAKLPPDQYQASWPSIYDSAVKIHPELAKSLNPQQPVPQEQLGQLGLGLQTQQQYIAQEEERRKAAKAPAEQAEAESKAGTAKSEEIIKGEEAKAAQQFGAMTPAQADNRYRFIQQKQNAKQPISADDQNFAKAYEKQKLLVPSTVAVIKGDTMGQNREYPVYDTKNKTTIMANASEINRASKEEPGRYQAPGYSSEALIQKYTAKDFAPGGKGSEEMRAYDTATAHAYLLQKAGDALDNGDVRLLNKLGNELGVQFGSDKKTNYQIIANAYTAETTKALTGGHITDSELAKQGATMPADASGAQIKGAVNAYKALMGSKKKILLDYKNAGMKGQTPGDEQAAPASAPAAGDFFSRFDGKKKQ